MSEEIIKAINLLKENGYIIKKMTPAMKEAAKKCEECGYEGDCLDCACSVCIID